MLATTASSSRLASAAHSPYHAADRAASTSSSTFASLCLTAWNDPTGRPNWVRSSAYSQAMSRACSATPTCSQASARQPSSKARASAGPAPPAGPIRVAGVLAKYSRACLRVASKVGSSVLASPGAVPPTANRHVSAPAAAGTRTSPAM